MRSFSSDVNTLRRIRTFLRVHPNGKERDRLGVACGFLLSARTVTHTEAGRVHQQEALRLGSEHCNLFQPVWSYIFRLKKWKEPRRRTLLHYPSALQQGRLLLTSFSLLAGI